MRSHVRTAFGQSRTPRRYAPSVAWLHCAAAFPALILTAFLSPVLEEHLYSSMLQTSSILNGPPPPPYESRTAPAGRSSSSSSSSS
eukprot:CAMPEP_0182799092 /NCGR_PEP_ID=MMETSP0006_2-20121128/1701_1 /TAXON_ID=97485 /ORGANISM="Prymnesium parvum, Strain Texoma1" /LENGTH=85 /DNA_ID=CAMNT_0024924257 /DNA_START=632 /DNA_END=885 /DNA_ORIENTATION=-